MLDHAQIDLQFRGREHAICAYRIGDVLIDPGPQSCADTLLAALDGWQPHAILLTHIHLDHAAGCGSLLRGWPDTEVWVHERGAPHLIDPTRLVASATRLYGDSMQTLWGKIEPVPAERLVVLRGGESRSGFEVAYTPGHASHHVSYLHHDSATVFAGDVGGVRIGGGPVVPPTPPPDIDLELWAQSTETLRAWSADAIAIAHFGTFTDVESHLDELAGALEHWGNRARAATPEQYEAELRQVTGKQEPYDLAMPFGTLQEGILRYWKTAPDDVS